MKREEETNMEMTENRQFNSIDNRNLRTNEIDEFYEGTADTRDAQNMDKQGGYNQFNNQLSECVNLEIQEAQQKQYQKNLVDLRQMKQRSTTNPSSQQVPAQSIQSIRNVLGNYSQQTYSQAGTPSRGPKPAGSDYENFQVTPPKSQRQPKETNSSTKYKGIGTIEHEIEMKVQRSDQLENSTSKYAQGAPKGGIMSEQTYRRQEDPKIQIQINTKKPTAQTSAEKESNHKSSSQRYPFSNTSTKNYKGQPKIVEEEYLSRAYQIASSESKIQSIGQTGVAGNDCQQQSSILHNGPSPYKMSDDSTIVNMIKMNNGEEEQQPPESGDTGAQVITSHINGVSQCQSQVCRLQGQTGNLPSAVSASSPATHYNVHSSSMIFNQSFYRGSIDLRRGLPLPPQSQFNESRNDENPSQQDPGCLSPSNGLKGYQTHNGVTSSNDVKKKGKDVEIKGPKNQTRNNTTSLRSEQKKRLDMLQNIDELFKEPLNQQEIQRSPIKMCRSQNFTKNHSFQSCKPMACQSPIRNGSGTFSSQSKGGRGRRRDSLERAISLLKQNKNTYLRKLASEYKIDKNIETVKRNIEHRENSEQAKSQKSFKKPNPMIQNLGKGIIDNKHMPKLFNHKSVGVTQRNPKPTSCQSTNRRSSNGKLMSKYRGIKMNTIISNEQDEKKTSAAEISHHKSVVAEISHKNSVVAEISYNKSVVSIKKNESNDKINEKNHQFEQRRRSKSSERGSQFQRPPSAGATSNHSQYLKKKMKEYRLPLAAELSLKADQANQQTSQTRNEKNVLAGRKHSFNQHSPNHSQVNSIHNIQKQGSPTHGEGQQIVRETEQPSTIVNDMDKSSFISNTAISGFKIQQKATQSQILSASGSMCKNMKLSQEKSQNNKENNNEGIKIYSPKIIASQVDKTEEKPQKLTKLNEKSYDKRIEKRKDEEQKNEAKKPIYNCQSTAIQTGNNQNNNRQEKLKKLVERQAIQTFKREPKTRPKSAAQVRKSQSPQQQVNKAREQNNSGLKFPTRCINKSQSKEALINKDLDCQAPIPAQSSKQANSTGKKKLSLKKLKKSNQIIQIDLQNIQRQVQNLAESLATKKKVITNKDLVKIGKDVSNPVIIENVIIESPKSRQMKDQQTQYSPVKSSPYKNTLDVQYKQTSIKDFKLITGDTLKEQLNNSKLNESKTDAKTDLNQNTFDEENDDGKNEDEITVSSIDDSDQITQRKQMKQLQFIRSEIVSGKSSGVSKLYKFNNPMQQQVSVIEKEDETNDVENQQNYESFNDSLPTGGCENISDRDLEEFEEEDEGQTAAMEEIIPSVISPNNSDQYFQPNDVNIYMHEMNKPNLINLHQKVFNDEETIKQDSAWQTSMEQNTLDMKNVDDPYKNPYIGPGFKVMKKALASTVAQPMTNISIMQASTSQNQSQRALRFIKKDRSQRGKVRDSTSQQETPINPQYPEFYKYPKFQSNSRRTQIGEGLAGTKSSEKLTKDLRMKPNLNNQNRQLRDPQNHQQIEIIDNIEIQPLKDKQYDFQRSQKVSRFANNTNQRAIERAAQKLAHTTQPKPQQPRATSTSNLRSIKNFWRV